LSLNRADLLKRTLRAASSFSLVWLTGQREADAGEEGAPDASVEVAKESAQPAPVSPPATAPGPLKTAYDYAVPYDGVRVPLGNFRGKAVVVCNAKTDDPESLAQIPGLTYLTGKYR